MAAKAKINLILCSCGDSLAKKLDWKRLTKSVSNIEGVLSVDETATFCQPAEQKKMVALIKKRGGEKIVVVGCSPKLYEDKLKEIIREEGLNPHLLTCCNLREHLLWTSGDKIKPLEEILPFIEASIARANALEPIEEEELPINQRVLIIGGGIAGLQSALELSALGIKSTIVEREDKLGGKLLKLGKFYQCDISPREFIRSKIEEAKGDKNIEVLTQAEVLQLKGYPGNFDAIIRQGEQKKEEIFGAVVISTGYQTLYPGSSYQITPSERVLTQLQLEEMIGKQEESKILQQLEQKSRILFINGMIGEDSKLTTASALKNALLLREKYNCQIFIACQQVKVAAQPLERMYRQAREKGIIFFKYMHQPPELKTLKSKPTALVFDPLLSSEEVKNPKIKIPCDLLVLEEKIVPDLSIQYLLQWLGIDTDFRGFFQRDNVHLLPVESNKKGIYTVGSSRKAISVPEVLADAGSAALEIYQHLSKETQLVNKSRAVVDKGLCALCLTCLRHCPHSSITYDRAAVIIEASCQGCGICASECPASAIEIRNYNTDQILAEMERL